MYCLRLGCCAPRCTRHYPLSLTQLMEHFRQRQTQLTVTTFDNSSSQSFFNCQVTNDFFVPSKNSRFFSTMTIKGKLRFPLDWGVLWLVTVWEMSSQGRVETARLVPWSWSSRRLFVYEVLPAPVFTFHYWLLSVCRHFSGINYLFL